MIDLKLRNKELKDKHKGESCFLIGSGPSLNKHDLSKILDKPVFVTSFFYLHNLYPEFKKVYYSYSAQFPCNWGNRLPTGMFPKISLNDNTIYFFDECFNVANTVREYFPKEKLYYCAIDRKNPSVTEGTQLHTDITKPLTYCHTIVADYVLPIIHYMGFDTVYVIGCDSSRSNSKEVPSHFYKKEELPEVVQEMIGKYSSGFKPDQLNRVWKIWKEKYEKDGKELLNAGIGGQLDVLERVNWNDII